MSMSSHRFPSGTVAQSGLIARATDHAHQKSGRPCLGIVLNVYAADDPFNKSGVSQADKKGTSAQAQVLIVNDGRDTPWILPNVVILPPHSTGADNYSEELPRPCSSMLDGSVFRTNGQNIDPHYLDGDWCVINFIGDSVSMPYMDKWFPHPSNFRDAVTANKLNLGNPVQGRRSVRRFQGTKWTLTSKGSIFVDTSEANSKLLPGKDPKDQSRIKVTRSKQNEGGDIDVTLKKERSLTLDWNPPVVRTNEPDLLGNTAQEPRDPPLKTGTRETTATRIQVDQDLINMVAGKVVEIIAQTEHMNLIAEKVASLISNSANILIQAATSTLVDAQGGDAVMQAATTALMEAKGGMATMKSPVNAALDAPFASLALSAPGNPLTDGVVLASGIDTCTGLPYGLLGNASLVVTAKK